MDSAPTDEPPSTQAGLLAAIDIGSNSFRLEIGQLQHGRYRRIDYLKETVRLGGGLDGHGLLTESAAQRGLDCLARFAQRLSGFKTQQVRAVATQTLREARNRDAFLLRAQATLGHPIEVVSGREEARLIYVGVAHLQPSIARRLVVDIGGRSTEMILGRGPKPRQAESFQVGSVSLSMRFFPEGKLTDAAFRAAQVATGAELEEALGPFGANQWQEALGSSGTVGAVSHLLSDNGITDGRITPDGLRWCIARCLEAGHVDRLKLTGLKDDRRAVIAGGLSILYTLCVHFGIQELLPAKGALRQGVIIDLHGRLEAQRRSQPSDMRDESVQELQRRFLVDAVHAERVRAVALALYGAVTPGGNGDGQRELGWACALHEIGMMVSHHDHHRHSAYLLGHVDAPGFSQSQQRRVGELALGQRGGLRKVEASLSNEAFAWQVMCLRLAILKCHARSEVDPNALRLRRNGRSAQLLFDPAWARAHPRTIYLLQEEAATWERSGVLRLDLY
jgi:exopolyphosphatase/guanosine-5'-triphosphate,3'-diphosphate pyrophosphatase